VIKDQCGNQTSEDGVVAMKPNGTAANEANGSSEIRQSTVEEAERKCTWKRELSEAISNSRDSISYTL